MAEHNTLTDPELHEPKGVAAAAAGQVYVADGGGSGSWTTFGDDVVIVNSAADLPTPILLGGVNTIRLEAKQYLINKSFSMNTPLAWPGAGLQCQIRAINRSVVTYTGANALWRDPDAQGQIELQGLTQWEAPNGNMFDVTAVTGSFGFQSVGGGKFTNCNALGTLNMNGTSTTSFFFGTLSNFDQGLVVNNPAFFETNTNFVKGNNAASCTYFTIQGASAVGTINFFTNTFNNGTNETAFNLNTNLTGVDSINFVANHQEGGINGTVFAAGGLNVDSVRVYSSGNDGLMRNTRPDGLLSMTGNATNTVITTTGVPVLVAGTWVVQRTSQTTGTTAGRITFNSSRNEVMPIAARVSIEPVTGLNKKLSVLLAKNGTVVAASKASTFTDTAVPVSVTVLWQDEVTANDFWEVYVQNDTDTTDILVSNAVLRLN